MRSFDQNEEHRTTVVPKTERYGAFGASLLCLPDEGLLLSYGRIDFEREVHQKVIVAGRSRSRSWSEPQIIHEMKGIPKTMRGDSLSLLSDGRIAMIGVTGPEGMGTGFEIRFSHDGGATWGDPIIGASKGTVPWSNRIIETDRGLLLTTRAPMLGGSTRKVVMQNLSRDGGLTWEGPRVIAEDPVLKLTEPSTIRLACGRLMTVIRETSYNFFPSYGIFSDDEGENWTDPVEMPFLGHEMCLGQLGSGRIMVAYRHVGGYAATLAWAGDSDEATGFQIPATIRVKHPPRIEKGYLSIEASGRGETILYHLHPPESRDSTISLEAVLRCMANDANACGIHMAQAGWVSFHPDRVELPQCGGYLHPSTTRCSARTKSSAIPTPW